MCVSLYVCVGGGWGGGGGGTDYVTACMCHGDVCLRVCQNIDNISPYIVYGQNEMNFGFVCPWCQNEIKCGYMFALCDKYRWKEQFLKCVCLVGQYAAIFTHLLYIWN